MADFETLKDWVKCSWRSQAEWRRQAEDDFAFVAGHQWTEAEKAEMDEISRAPLVFNKTSVLIYAVAGSEINNRTEVRFIPREIGDAKPNEILSAGGEWFRDQADAEDADSEAFFNLLVCGLGVTDTTLDFEEDPEGEPSMPVIDPLSFGWDEFGNGKGLADANYKFVVEQRPTREMKRRFPDFEVEEIHASWIETDKKGEPHETNSGDQYGSDGDTPSELKDTVTVVRIQYRERVQSVEFIGPDGQKQEMPQEKWDVIASRLPQQPPHRKMSKWVWKQAFLGNMGILEENQPDPEGCTINVMTGYWDKKKKMFYGLLRPMRDPQRFSNKIFSTTMHMYSTNAKGGVMVETDAVEDIGQFEESWAAADSVTWMKPGRMGAIQEKPKPQMPAFLMSMLDYSAASIRDASGVNLELLGLQDREQAGILEYQRKQAAMSTLARFFDSLRFYRKMQGRTILNMLRNYVAPTGRLVRIVKDDNAQYVPLAMAMDVQKYDVIVDDSPQAPNEKEKAWSVIQTMLPMLMQSGMGLEDWADILEYSPLPLSFSEKVRQRAADIKQKGSQPDPMQMAILENMKADVEKKRADVVDKQAGAYLDAMRAKQIAEETRIAPAKAVADIAKGFETAPRLPAPERPTFQSVRR